MNTEKFRKLIDTFKKIPHTEMKDETFISICGYPHYERVSSNILAFFLDTSREHNLKDLFIKSLLEAAEFDPRNYPNDFKSETEVLTTKHNFIDILLKNDDINIVIENKIYAKLYNDLNDYYNKAKEECDSEPIGIVLSLNEFNVTNKKFRNVTYKMLLNRIESNLESYKENANEKYLPFLYDYLDNIKFLKTQKQMNDTFLNLVKQNQNDVVAFENEVVKLRKELRSKVKSLNDILRQRIEDQNTKIWAWRDIPKIMDDAVVDFFPNGNKKLDIALDSIIELSGWYFLIWIRDNKTGKVIDIEMKMREIGYQVKLDSESKKTKYKVEKQYAFDADLSEVADFVSFVVNELSKKL